ncbi:MAG TPA: 50S ribosomal protein L17 [Vicinamibacterales bacterium]|nr:50S ribosomal protein L17 [Vicinamibacterales bacterium]
MRHRVAHRKLGRVTEHRIAMLRNQASALLLHERIETTVPKAKELKPFVERIITIAKRSLADTSDPVRGVNARRLVARDIADKAVVTKLFDEIAPRFVERPGGYTRLLRLGHRRGDSADVALIELVGSEFDPNAEPKTRKGKAKKASGEGETTPAKRAGVGGRLRAAAERLRSKADKPDTEPAKPRRTGPTKRGT